MAGKSEGSNSEPPIVTKVLLAVEQRLKKAVADNGSNRVKLMGCKNSSVDWAAHRG